MTHRDGDESLSDPADGELMRRVAAGQTAALAQLVRRHQGRVRAVAYRVLGNVPDADDVTQETFLRLWRSADRYAESGHFLTWLLRISTNLCLDHQRRSRRQAISLEEEIPSNPPVSPTESAETIEAVRRAVSSLPERQRIVLVLHRYESRSYREIAQITGWSESAVESLLVRAYANLRRELDALRTNSP